MKDNVNSKIEKRFCTGCGACQERCPKSCITMEYEPNIGFRYPIVNNEVCIECGVCSKACSVLREDQGLENLLAYAAVANDTKLLRSANSGGVFSVIAKYIISTGGYVCGAAFTKVDEVKHIVVDSFEGLKCLRVTSTEKGCHFLES